MVDEGQEDSDFTRWCFTAELEADRANPFNGTMTWPLMTVLLYRICDNQPGKFDLANQMLAAAFEAGRQAEKNSAN